MPALNFQKQFAAIVESGQKRQTIRAYRKGGRDPKPGDTLYLYTGMRTKQCRKLGEVRCQSAWPIRIYKPRNRRNQIALQVLALAVEMLGWFERVHGLPFEGLVIRW